MQHSETLNARSRIEYLRFTISTRIRSTRLLREFVLIWEISEMDLPCKSRHLWGSGVIIEVCKKQIRQNKICWKQKPEPGCLDQWKILMVVGLSNLFFYNWSRPRYTTGQKSIYFLPPIWDLERSENLDSTNTNELSYWSGIRIPINLTMLRGIAKESSK
jgi:hypothetical protein